jgi:putative transposase
LRKDTKIIGAESGKEMQTLSLDEIARVGAQEMLRMALNAEIDVHLDQFSEYRLPDGRPQLVRNGTHAARQVTIGSGQIMVQVPRTRRRGKDVENYSSSILPKYMRRSPKIDEVIPILYLKGISTGNMYPALEKLLGESVSGLSAANISRLKSCWKKEYDVWRKRDLSETEYCYIWVDGIYTGVRFSEDRLCTLVVIGATVDGHKELIAVQSGYRESTESWKALLRELKRRGLKAPRLAIGDGALGFWSAIGEIFPETKWQRCWLHKMLNVLDKLPQSQQGKAKRMLDDIYKADTKAEADKAFDAFIENFEAKHYRATECLQKDREHLLTFYSFPSKHWKHIRTTNPIESTFATVRLRTNSTRGHGTEETTFMMIFKLLEQASLRWQRIWGHKLIPLVMNNETFIDGELKKAA